MKRIILPKLVEVQPGLWGRMQYKVHGVSEAVVDIVPYLQRWREHHQWTAAQMAEVIGTSKRTVQGWFYGHRPADRLAGGICKLLSSVQGVTKKKEAKRERR